MFFFFNDTATTEIYTLSLHDALPIFRRPSESITTASPPITSMLGAALNASMTIFMRLGTETDRKSTRLNSSHQIISYAVFCLKKKKYNCYMPRNFCRVTHQQLSSHAH